MTIDRLNEELLRLENSLAKKDAENSESMKVLDQKNNALVSDLKFMRGENQKLLSRVKEANDNVLQMDQQVAQASQEHRQVQSSIDDLRRKVLDQESVLKAKDQQLSEVTSDLQANEAEYFSKIKALQTSLSTIRSESSQAQQMMKE